MSNNPAPQSPAASGTQDPFELREYRLQNGMRLFMSVNRNEPRINTQIAVRAGSKQDPPETTGLAHYMEHMLFKGSSRIGTKDWEQEKVYLERISDLFEQHRQSRDPEERKKIYREIDRLSSEAAALVAPNEYDKLATAIGAKGTNAYTWLDQTVFLNDIPSNELERWMELESERFRMLSLRLFHTELETVYEEFNISQDRDFRKVNKAIREVLFPSHPYGTQTTIGSAQHLKSPSMKNIQWYFRTYYAPNNMGIILAGDFEPEHAIALAEKYFGGYEQRAIPPFEYAPQPELESPVVREVFGQEAPFVDLAWRLEGPATDQPFVLSVVQSMLHNQRAGLIDEHLLRPQRLLEAQAWTWIHEDYSVFGLYGKAREGQEPEAVQSLLLEQIERLKTGDFEPWLLEGALRDLRMQELQATENNQMRAHLLTNAFVLGIDWQRFISRFEALEKLTPDAISAFARRHLHDRFVTVFKRQGADPDVVKVEKPDITPVNLDREALSDYGRRFLTHSSPELPPVFADFDGEIEDRSLANGQLLQKVHNPDNQLFSLSYIFETGKASDPLLAPALSYLPYLGTSRTSVSERQQKFFQLGLRLKTQLWQHRFRITMQGMDEALEEGVAWLDHLLQEVAGKPDALQNLVADILLKRENAKKDKQTILHQAMVNYARYGSVSPFTDRLSRSELQSLDPQDLAAHLQKVARQPHRIYYYGQLPGQKLDKVFENHPAGVESLVPPEKNYPELDSHPRKIFFVHFPMVQAELLLLSRGTPQFNLEEHLLSQLYNEYFGYGLSSIVFQEIRESRALAYATFAYYNSPSRQHRSHYLRAFIGTQPDKVREAISAMTHILEEMPVVPEQIEQARRSIRKRIETERIPPRSIYWEAMQNEDLGYRHDLRKDLYQKMGEIDASDLEEFHRRYVRGRSYHLLVLGDRGRLDLDYLRSLGEVEELSLEQIFGG